MHLPAVMDDLRASAFFGYFPRSGKIAVAAHSAFHRIDGVMVGYGYNGHAEALQPLVTLPSGRCRTHGKCGSSQGRRTFRKQPSGRGGRIAWIYFGLEI